VFAYLRTAESADRFLVVLNFGSEVHPLDLSQVGQQATIEVATDMVRRGVFDLASIALGADEGLVLRCL
jgi:hypothetical protein